MPRGGSPASKQIPVQREDFIENTFSNCKYILQYSWTIRKIRFSFRRVARGKYRSRQEYPKSQFPVELKVYYLMREWKADQ